MNVVYIATDSYISLMGVSLFSLLENTKDLDELHIFILSPDLTGENKKVLLSMSAQYKCKLTFYDIPDYENIFKFNTSGFHPIVLVRLLLADILPESIDFVLYLDCDVIVNDSLQTFESISLENFAFAAVPELAMPTAQKEYLGLSAEDQYFNSGVLYINLQYWRVNDLKRTFLDYYLSMNDSLLYPDQDILNHCCKNCILPISHRYNFPPVLNYFPRYFIKRYQPAYYCKSHSEYSAIRKTPVMIHFLGDERPWFRGNFSPYRNIYLYYKSLSPWKDVPLTRGRELYLFCYHMLNCLTFICPWFRRAFTKYIGIRYYKMKGKKGV